MAALAKRQKSPEIIRAGIKETVVLIRRGKADLDRNLMKLASLIREVKTRRLWNDWHFYSFDAWREREIEGIKRTQVYKALSIQERLAPLVSDEKMESLGPEKAYHLSQLAKHKPKLVEKALEKIEDPKVTVAETETLVSRAISGQGVEGRPMKNIGILVYAEDLLDVERVFSVLQHLDPLPGGIDPDTDFGRGLHLVGLCREFQSGEEYKGAAKELEEACDRGFTVEL